jgi:hypothetical protein
LLLLVLLLEKLLLLSQLFFWSEGVLLLMGFSARIAAVLRPLLLNVYQHMLVRFY